MVVVIFMLLKRKGTFFQEKVGTDDGVIGLLGAFFSSLSVDFVRVKRERERKKLAMKCSEWRVAKKGNGKASRANRCCN